MKQDSRLTYPLEMSLVHTTPMSQAHNTTLNSDSLGGLPSSSMVQISVTRLQGCRSLCICSCHQRQHYRSPRFMDSVIGCLFLGYNGSPYSSQKCDTETCQKRSVKTALLKYVFPAWLLYRAVYLTVMLSQSKGPELVIRCAQVRPSASKFFQAMIQRIDKLDGITTMSRKG